MVPSSKVEGNFKFRFILATGIRTSRANHSTRDAMEFKRWNGFSATNTSRNEAKLAYIILNIQTPCPPRGAVPVNQRCRRRLFHSRHPVRSRSWMRLSQLFEG